MFEDLGKQLQAPKKKVTIKAVPYDPSQLGDELATRTEWGPAKSGGASSGTHRLIDAGPGRVEFRATEEALAFYALFAAAALAIVILPVAGIASMGLQWRTLLILPLLVVGSVFLSKVGAIWYHGSAPIVFDKQRGEYWKGRGAPAEAANRHQIKERLELDRIHALQLIFKFCGGDDSYYSYELNLVLDDATRLNVVDHGNREELRKDAEELAKFLGRPLWDATE